MPKTRLATATKAAADIHRAKRVIEAARRRLANATRPADAPYVLLDPALRWAQEAIDARGKEFARVPGVIGYGLGRVMKKGLPTGELCVTVFVREKLLAKELKSQKARALPKSITVHGKRLRVDVMAIGRIKLHLRAGTSVGPDDFAEEGTIGAFARDIDTQGRVAITAMHVTGRMDFPDGSAAPQFDSPSRLSNAPAPLGRLAFGTRTGIDAAKIALFGTIAAENVIDGIGEIAGWRPITIPGDQSLPVRLVGAVSHQIQHGVVVFPNVALPANGLASAIVADIPTQPGDSGAALIDPHNHIIGFLVGAATTGPFANLRIFSPAALVMRVLRCDIP